MLSLEAETISFAVDAAVFTRDRAVEKIARIELQPGFGRSHLQRSSGGWLVHFGRQRESGGGSGQDPVVVVATANRHLRVFAADARADPCRLSEIEWCFVDGCQFARGDES